MQINLYYEYASIVISLFLLVYFGTTKKSSGFQNKVFLMLIIANTFTAAFDVINKLIDYKGGNVDLLRLTTMGYFITHLMILPLIFFYILSSIKNWYELTAAFKIFISFPISVAFIVLLSNPITHFIYTYEANGDYIRGPGYIMLYILVGIYMGLMLFLLVYYREYFSFIKKVIFILEILILIASMLIQAINYNQRVETFGITYSLLLMFFFIQNPRDQVDVETGLYNVTSFYEVMGLNLASGNYFNLVEVIVSDFDEVNLKKVKKKSNDVSNTLAFQIGEFLKEVEDVTVYRLKNNVFCLEISDMAEEDIIKVIRKIRNRFTMPWNVNGYDVQYKIKMCHIAIPEEIDTMAKLTGIINGSLFKDINKEILSVSDFDLGKLERQTGLNAAIAKGLEDNNMEIVFSPVCSVKDRRIISADTSVRIFDSEIGYISKDEILDFVEKNGKIGLFSRIHFEGICRFIKEYNPLELGIMFVGVELTSAMCHQIGFVDYMVNRVEELNIKPTAICFKVSEYTVHMAPELIRDIMAKLQAKGFKFALDEYGSGFTNLASIYELNFDYIKISEQVVKEAMINDKAKITLESTFELAKDLGMRTVVGGIDNEQWFNIIANAGCEYAIGAYFLENINSRELINILVAQENVSAMENIKASFNKPLEGGGIA